MGFVMLSMLPRLGNYAVRLVAVLCRQLPVPPQNLFRCQQLLGVPRPVRRNLCGGWAVNAVGADVVLHLLPSQAVSRKIFLAVPSDLRLISPRSTLSPRSFNRTPNSDR